MDIGPGAPFSDTYLLDWVMKNWQTQEFGETMEFINDPEEWRKKLSELIWEMAYKGDR